jgi:hypothetical protein
LTDNDFDITGTPFLVGLLLAILLEVCIRFTSFYPALSTTVIIIMKGDEVSPLESEVKKVLRYVKRTYVRPSPALVL